MQLAISHSPLDIIIQQESHLYLTNNVQWRMANGQCGIRQQYRMQRQITNVKWQMENETVSKYLLDCLLCFNSPAVSPRKASGRQEF
jgi:hypothetical protein